jgi:hypothetical protein
VSSEHTAGQPLLVVIAPAARQVDAESVRIAKDVLSGGAAVKVVMPENAAELDRMLAHRGRKRPVVIGDDRALHRVVEALHRQRELTAATLGLVPVGGAGTAALARALGVPTEPVAAARAILGGGERRLDLLVDDSGGVVLGGLRIPGRTAVRPGARNGQQRIGQQGSLQQSNGRADGGRRGAEQESPDSRGPTEPLDFEQLEPEEAHCSLSAKQAAAGRGSGCDQPYHEAHLHHPGHDHHDHPDHHHDHQHDDLSHHHDQRHDHEDEDEDDRSRDEDGGRWRSLLTPAGLGRTARSVARACTGAVPALLPGSFGSLALPGSHTPRLRVEADGTLLTDLNHPVRMVAVRLAALHADRSAPAGLDGSYEGAVDVLVRPPSSTGRALRVRARTVTVIGRDFSYEADSELSGPVRCRTWTVLPGAWQLSVPIIGSV